VDFRRCRRLCALMKLLDGNGMECVEILPLRRPTGIIDCAGSPGAVKRTIRHVGGLQLSQKRSWSTGHANEARIDQERLSFPDNCLCGISKAPAGGRGALLSNETGRALCPRKTIYLQAERSPMPELRLVGGAGLQDRLAYDHLRVARLGPVWRARLIVERPPPSTGVGTTRTCIGGSPGPAATSTRLIAEAARDLADYQRLPAGRPSRGGGAEAEELKRALRR